MLYDSCSDKKHNSLSKCRDIHMKQNDYLNMKLDEDAEKFNEVLREVYT